MSLYDDERVMYIPLSIDSVETNKGNYFFSSSKIVEMVVGVVPYFFLLFPLMQGGQIIPIIIITIVYGFLFSFFFRFRIMEEGRLRKMLRELDANKLSGINYFWGINKIGNRGLDDGVIHYERSGYKTERGLVVSYDRGSLVAVPEGSYNEYRKTKMNFIRELSKQDFDFTWYEIPVKEDDIPQSLVHIFNHMTMMANPVYKQLLKLQLDINVAYTIGERTGYKDFILIRNTNFKTLRRFREIMENIVDNTLAHDKYILNPKVLNKNEVERFFGHVLMTNTVNSDSIKRNVDYRPITDFAEVVRIVGQDGSDMPLEFIDLTDFIEPKKKDSLESRLEKDLRKYDENIKILDKLKTGEINRIRAQRNNDNITDKEYHHSLKVIETKYKEYFDLVEDNKYEDFNINVYLRDIERTKREKEKKKIDQDRRKKDGRANKGKPKQVDNVDKNEITLDTDISIEDITIKAPSSKRTVMKNIEKEKELSKIALTDDLSLEQLLERERQLEELREDIDGDNIPQNDDSEDISLEELLRKERNKK